LGIPPVLRRARPGAFSFSPTDHVGFQSGRFLEAKVDENGKGYWEYFGPISEFQGIS